MQVSKTQKIQISARTNWTENKTVYEAWYTRDFTPLFPEWTFIEESDNLEKLIKSMQGRYQSLNSGANILEFIFTLQVVIMKARANDRNTIVEYGPFDGHKAAREFQKTLDLDNIKMILTRDGYDLYFTGTCHVKVPNGTVYFVTIAR